MILSIRYFSNVMNRIYSFYPDSSIESEMEFELNENETVEDLIAHTINKLGIPNQIDGAIKSISSRLDALNSDATDIDANFLALEK